MLKKDQKKEMLKDGCDKNRMRDFAAKKESIRESQDSLDDYIQFVTSIQKIFPDQSVRRGTITRFNKL